MCIYSECVCVCVCVLAIVMHTIDSPRLFLLSNWTSSTEDVNSEAIEASEASKTTLSHNYGLLLSTDPPLTHKRHQRPSVDFFQEPKSGSLFFRRALILGDLVFKYFFLLTSSGIKVYGSFLESPNFLNIYRNSITYHFKVQQRISSTFKFNEFKIFS